MQFFGVLANSRTNGGFSLQNSNNAARINSLEGLPVIYEDATMRSFDRHTVIQNHVYWFLFRAVGPARFS